METSRSGTPAAAVSHLQRVLEASEQFARCVTRQHSSHPTPRACHGSPHDPVAALRSWLRHFGPRTTTPAQNPGQSITRKCNAFGANKGFEC